MTGFKEYRVEYKKRLGEDGEYRTLYKSYFIDGAAVREVFSIDEEAVGGAAVTMYFFPARSVCTGEDGERSAFPRPEAGDLCVIRHGSDDERVLRVSEIGYFTGAGELSHIRLKMR